VHDGRGGGAQRVGVHTLARSDSGGGYTGSPELVVDVHDGGAADLVLQLALVREPRQQAVERAVQSREGAVSAACRQRNS
jgi:hypothetical protein